MEKGGAEAPLKPLVFCGRFVHEERAVSATACGFAGGLSGALRACRYFCRWSKCWLGAWCGYRRGWSQMASLSIADDLDHTMGSTTRAPNGASGVGSESHWSDADDENDAVWPSLGYLCAPDAGVGWSAAKEHELDGGGRIGEDTALCEEGRWNTGPDTCTAHAAQYGGEPSPATGSGGRPSAVSCGRRFPGQIASSTVKSALHSTTEKSQAWSDIQSGATANDGGPQSVEPRCTRVHITRVGHLNTACSGTLCIHCGGCLECPRNRDANLVCRCTALASDCVHEIVYCALPSHL